MIGFKLFIETVARKLFHFHAGLPRGHLEVIFRAKISHSLT